MMPLNLTIVVLLSIVLRIECQNGMTCGRRLIEHTALMTYAARAQSWPWHAAIYHRRVNDSVPEYQCGGTVITARYILTAGHCVWEIYSPIETNRVSVALGRLRLSFDDRWVQSFQVDRIDVHLNYSTIDLRNDIAIIRLATAATFNNYVQPICLWNAARTDLSDVVGRSGTVIGFGLTENFTLSMELREASMPVVSFMTCLQSYPSFFGPRLDDTNFCAGIRNGTSVCRGDSGGSLSFQESGSYYIRGIVSLIPAIVNKTTLGIRCDSTHYAMFTDVAKYLQWIEETAGCKKRVHCQDADVPASQQDIKCGKRLTAHTPLMTHATTAEHWPWHAAIYHRRVADSVPEYQCGGTVITATSVLTAAHCVYKRYSKIETNLISVSLGRLRLSSDENWVQSFEVARIDVHPNYNPIGLRNDIAIIRLAAAATFNNYVRPVCLWNAARTDLSDVVGRDGTVIGFGLTEHYTASMELREASMPVVNLTTCLRSYRSFFGEYLSETTFCAGIRNGTSVCTGDTGGSMTFQESGSYYIRGIVSLGPSLVNKTTQERRCDPTQYAMFTDVAQYLPWIEETTGCKKVVECP